MPLTLFKGFVIFLMLGFDVDKTRQRIALLLVVPNYTSGSDAILFFWPSIVEITEQATLNFSSLTS
jgi:hypothetical protein